MSDFVRIIRIKNANGEEKQIEIPAKLDLERPKRPRTVFSEKQLEQLEIAFNGSGYLCGKSRLELAEKLGLSDNQVKVWFQNRRTKQKRCVASPKTSQDPTTTTMTADEQNNHNPNSTYYWSQFWATNSLLQTGKVVV